MVAPITFSEVDLTENVIDMGWYRMKITGIDEQPSKAGDSMNWIIETEIVGTKYDGWSLKTYLNEKVKSRRKGFVRAVNGGVTLVAGVSYQIDDAIGKVVEGLVKPEAGPGGKIYNRLEDFAPLGTNLSV